MSTKNRYGYGIVEGFDLKKAMIFKCLSGIAFGKISIYEKGRFLGEFGKGTKGLNVDLHINHPNFYKKVLLGGAVGAGESYVDGDWSTSNLTQFLQFFIQNEEALLDIEKKLFWLFKPLNKLKHFKNKNSLSQAKKNILQHYDLGNDFYKSFLDKTMLYSSAMYSEEAQSLHEAQLNKLKMICEKLNLKDTDHVVEIGTGWGALALFMAKNYGCRVTTTTISDMQFEYTQKKIQEEGLEDKITLLKKDYRLLNGEYDKLVSIEMIEAVGKEYMDGFLKKCESLLRPEGKMIIQAITIADQEMAAYKNNVDFIQKHIFPGGFLPSLQMLVNKTVLKTNLAIRDVQDIGLDYARTLRDWRNTFEEKYDNLKAEKFDERFFRLWKYYLEYCEAGFLERRVSTVQIVFTKVKNKDL